MLTIDHPNAVWLSALYRGMSAIANDQSLDASERTTRTNAHIGECFERVSPHMIIHTGGVRLSVTGDLTFMRAYGRRRASLCDSFSFLSIDQILADDEYGIVHGVSRATRGEEIWDRIGMGAWRFENGLAVEHWELANGPRWDAFFLAGDADFQPASAIEFWTKA